MRRLARLSDREVETLVRELRDGDELALGVLDEVDYDSLVRIRIAVHGYALRDLLHARLVAESNL